MLKTTETLYENLLLRLNNHEATCGILPYLKSELVRDKLNKFIDDNDLNLKDFCFLNEEQWYKKNYWLVEDFIKKTHHNQKIFYYDIYDGWEGLNYENGRFYFRDTTLRYLDFQIAKQLRRIKAQLEMGNNCSYCRKVIDSNLYNYNLIQRQKGDREKLKDLNCESFQELIKTIDFYIIIDNGYLY